MKNYIDLVMTNQMPAQQALDELRNNFYYSHPQKEYDDYFTDQEDFLVHYIADQDIDDVNELEDEDDVAQMCSDLGGFSCVHAVEGFCSHFNQSCNNYYCRLYDYCSACIHFSFCNSGGDE